MKILILISLLAALAVCYDTASVLPAHQEKTIYVEEGDESITKYFDQRGATGRATSDGDMIVIYECVPFYFVRLLHQNYYHPKLKYTHCWLSTSLVPMPTFLYSSHLNFRHISVRRTNLFLQCFYTTWSQNSAAISALLNVLSNSI